MNIEIITTKKKLTKSLFEQFKTISYMDLLRISTYDSLDGIVLGHIHYKDFDWMIAKIDGNYYSLKLFNWVHDSSSDLLLKSGKYFKKFPTREEKYNWLEAYNKIKPVALKTQIYI